MERFTGFLGLVVLWLFFCGTSFVGKSYEPDIISKWYSGTIRSSLAPHQYFNIGLQNLLNISLELIRLDLMHNTLKQIESTCYIFPCCLNQRAFCSSMQIPGTHFSLFRCFCGCERFVLTSRLAHISLFRIGALYL